MITRTDGTFDGGEEVDHRAHLGRRATLQDQINLELPLKNGDIITALPKSFVTVDGEVNRPGRYAIESDLTVTGAISLAGGLTRFGSSGVKVRRTDPQTGKVTIIEVDLKDVPQRQEAGRAAAAERRDLRLAPGVLMASVPVGVGGPAARRRPRHRPPLLRGPASGATASFLAALRRSWASSLGLVVALVQTPGVPGRR